MSLSLYMDHNVIGQITIGCRFRGLDVLTALEDGFDLRSDEEVPARATELGRIVFTHDTDFIAITGEGDQPGHTTFHCRATIPPK